MLTHFITDRQVTHSTGITSNWATDCCWQMWLTKS